MESCSAARVTSWTPGWMSFRWTRSKTQTAHHLLLRSDPDRAVELVPDFEDFQAKVGIYRIVFEKVIDGLERSGRVLIPDEAVEPVHDEEDLSFALQLR